MPQGQKSDIPGRRAPNTIQQFCWHTECSFAVATFALVAKKLCCRCNCCTFLENIKPSCNLFVEKTTAWLAGGVGVPTKTGQCVLTLQKVLPRAKVLYSSATGASEPYNLVRSASWLASER